MTVFDIDPISVAESATKVDIQLIDFQLNAKEVDASVVLLNSYGRAIQTRIIRIPPEIYSKWEADDNFIVNYIIQRLVSS